MGTQKELSMLQNTLLSVDKIVTDIPKVDLNDIANGTSSSAKLCAEVNSEVHSYSVLELLQPILREYRIKADAEGKEIHFQIECSEPSLLIYADAIKFQRVISNLLSNSFKAISSRGEIHIQVFLEETMAFEKTEFMCAAIIVSKNPERLFNFYRDGLGFPLEVEQHGNSHKHYGCELGDLHFAIHPVENFEGKEPGVGSIKLDFEIFDMESFLVRLKDRGIEPLYPPRPLMPGSLITAVRDPDGNEIEFTALSAGWFKHLEERKRKGIDVVERWKSLQGERS